MSARYIALSILILATGVSGQQDVRPTLPEIVRRQAPTPVLRTRQRELFPQSLEEMVPKADLVLYGSVTSVKSYVSADQKDVYTDYVIAPIRVIHERTPSIGRPGQPTSITVKRWGGQTMIDGVQVVAEDLDLRQFRLGEEVVLVLTYDKADGKFQMPSQVSGAFLVIQGRIEPLVEHSTYARLRGMSVDDLDTLTQRSLK